MNYEELVKQIRESAVLGRGSCSWVDECLTDEELTRELKRMVDGDGLCSPMKNPTPKKLLRELKVINRAVMERL